MGYTHYWYKRGDISVNAWSKLCQDMGKVMAEPAVACSLAGGMGDVGSLPICNHSEITFNGIGPDSHETFYLTRHTAPEDCDKDGKAFAFCKTNLKPYDAVVCAALILLAQHTTVKAVQVSSDGQYADFVRGFELLRAAGIKVTARTVAKLKQALGVGEAVPVVAGISLRRQASW